MQYSSEISEKLQEAKQIQNPCFNMQQVTLRFPQTYDRLPQVFLFLDCKFCSLLGSLASAFVPYNDFTGAQLQVSESLGIISFCFFVFFLTILFPSLLLSQNYYCVCLSLGRKKIKALLILGIFPNIYVKFLHRIFFFLVSRTVIKQS